jgi:hypothetical protein
MIVLRDRAPEHRASPPVTLRPLLNGAGDYLWGHHPAAFPLTDPVALDMLDVVCAVHLADRVVTRRRHLDGFRRHVDLRVPVRRPAVWEGLTDLVEGLVRFATADVWRLEWVKRRERGLRLATAPVRNGARLVGQCPAATVAALFSGGLDSLCGAADLARHPKERPLFVSHSPPGRDTLLELLDGVWQGFGHKGFPPGDGVTFRLQIRERKEGEDRRTQFFEPTRRSRPVFFLGLAGAVAIQAGVPRIRMSENGALALSLPSRADSHGPMIARQAHPYLLRRFAMLLDRLAPSAGGWEVANPFANKTKGECCLLLGKESRELARRTSSCEYLGRQAAVVRHWRKTHRGNAAGRWRLGKGPQCGLCIPCLVRRAALRHAHINDPSEDYFFDAPALLADPPQGREDSWPPLLRTVLPHLFSLRRFCGQLDTMTEEVFAIRFLPELRLLSDGGDGEEGDAVRGSYRLMKRFAREVLAFL